MDPLYYEAHVTLDPVFDDRCETLYLVFNMFGFRVAKLFMKKRVTSTPERSDLDSFCTGTSSELEPLKQRMFSLLRKLHIDGFVVRRYKIEHILLDSRIDDAVFPLSSLT